MKEKIDIEEKIADTYETIIKTNIDKNDNYRILNFCKNNISTSIAIASFVFAGLSSIMNIISFLIEKQELTFWNISKVYVSNNSKNFIYSIIILWFFNAFLFIGSQFISKKIDEFFYKNKYDIVKNAFYKKAISEYRKIMFRICLMRLQCSRDLFFTNILHFCKEDKKKNILNFKELKNGIKNNQKRGKNNIKLTKKMKKEESVLILYGVVLLIIDFLSFFFIWAFINYLYFSFFSMPFIYAIISSVCLTLIYMLFIIIGCFSAPIRTIKREAKRFFKEKFRNENISDYDEMKRIIDKISKEKIDYKKIYLSDGSLRKNIWSVFLFLFLSVIFSFVYSYTDYHSKKDFFVLNQNEKEYVLVYENEKTSIFEEAIINENEVTINTLKQYYSEKKEYQLTQYHFDKVNIINLKDNVSKEGT